MIYIVAGGVLGLVFVLVLLKIFLGKDKAVITDKYQNGNSLYSEGDIVNKVRELILAEKKIEAIKFVVKEKHLKSREGKDFVERVEKDHNSGNSVYSDIRSTTNSTAADNDLTKNILQLLSEGKKIQAIKIVRENKKISLGEAKRYVETMEERVR